MDRLQSLIAEELGQPVDPRVAEFAAAIAARHPGAARAVLFYGSCLRERQLDGLMLDFYLIVSDYRVTYDRRWLAKANRLIPPNVFPFALGGLTAKYAVLSEADFARECSPAARSASVFARFSQPARLVWSADETAQSRAITAVAEAVTTLLGKARGVMRGDEAADPLAVWRMAFTLTYGAELRAERASRPGAIVDADPKRYAALLDATGISKWPDTNEAGRAAARGHWRRISRKGKALSLVRLIKASFTFAGGIDYLAWKINRHAGTDIVVKPWQRRWPLLGALILLPRLLARGAIR
jgi:hypothetical protein